MATTIIRSGSKATIIMSGQGVPGPSGATASHWVGHKKGGVDEGKVEELATAGPVGSVPTSDGAGGLTMAVPAGGGNVTSPGGETAGRLAEFTGVNSIDDTTITTSSVSTHLADTANPHATDIGNLGTGTLAELNTKVTDATLDTSSASRPPDAHALGGAAHTADTLANLNTKVSDANLDDAGDSRTPSGSAAGDVTGTFPSSLVVSSITTTTGPQSLLVGAVADGQVLTRSGTAIIGSTAGVGDFVGPASSVDDRIVSFDGVTGKLGQDSGVSAPAVATHLADTANPHATDIENLGSGTLAELNAAVTDATLDTSSASRPPNGSASGDLTGSYPGPVVSALTTTTGPQSLLVGAVADGQFLQRSGTAIIGSTPGGSGDVVGPASSVDGNFALYDGTSGKLIKDDGISVPEANLITGILSGYVVTVNGDPAKFDISAGTGVVIDWTASPVNQITFVASGPFVAQVLPDISEAFTEIFIDSAGAVQAFSGASATPQQLRSMIRLRDVNHANGVSIIAFGEAQRLAFEGTQSVLDYIDKLGPISVGNKATPAATDLTVGKTAGVTTMPFFNASVDKQDPTNAVNAAIAVINPVIYSYQDGSGGFAFDFTNTEIDPDIFDDGTGVLTTMAGNRYAVQRFAHFSSSNVTLFFVPQFDYSSLAAAIAAVNAEGFILGFDGTRGVITTLIAIQGNTTDLTDTSDALFVSVSGAGGGGGAGGATTYLGLNDTTDSSYVGKAGQVSMANVGETGLDLTQIDHTNATHVANVGSNTHAQIDTHIAAVAPHTGVLDLPGTRVMTGDLQMGTQAITNAGNVTLADGVLSQSTAGAGTTAVASWAALGSSGGAHELFSVDVDPNTVVTGNPGDWCVRADGADSRTYQHRGTGASNTDWVEIGAAVAMGGGLFGSIWRFDDDVTASDPATGRFKYNNASPPSVTIVRQHEFDRGGADRTNFLSQVDTDDLIYAQEETTGDRSDLFLVVSKVTQTNHVDFTVTHVASGPSLIRNNRDCIVGFQVVLDHTHAHSDLTGVTSDQHHPQVHALGGADHSADTLANLNSKVSDATLDDSGDSRPPDAHALGGAAHSADTLANLNSKVSDATLDTSSASRPPNGSASGDLTGSYPAPVVSAVTTTTGPTSLVVGAVADGEFLKRVGATVVGASPSGSGDVVGPGSAVDTNLASFDTTTGKLIQDSGILTANVFLKNGSVTATGDFNLGSNDIVSVGTVDGVIVSNHSGRHENGGADEISVLDLSGLLADAQTPLAHALGGSAHSADTLANLNLKVSDATLDDAGDSRPPDAHALGGAAHSADTLANLNTKVSDATLDTNTASRPPNGSATGDLSGTYPAPVVAAITTTTGPTSLTIAGIATSTILQRSGTTIIGTILGADLIQRDGSVNFTGNQNFGNNSITNVNLVDAVDVNLVASRTHFWGFTINGPLSAAKSNEQILVLPFDCTIIEIVVIALETITTGDFTFRVQCGPDDESYVGGDLVGAAVTLDNSNKKIRSGGVISFAALEDDRLAVDVTAATGTQPSSDHDANFNVMVYYTRPIS